MNPLNSKFKRRGFMGVVGGSCAVISTAAVAQPPSSSSRSGGGRPPGPPQRDSSTQAKKNAVEGEVTHLTTDVLVVGGGMAGVFAAVTAHDGGAKVLLVDKGAVGRSGQTPFARGIFRYDESTAGMSKEAYLKGTAEAAEYMNNPVYTELMLDHSAACVDKLESWGFFKEKTYAKPLNSPLIERNIKVIERVTLTHLIKQGEHIAGAMGMYIDKNESVAIHAKSVILCTGASGFKPAGWQIGSLTSDGDAMAYRIGAEITGKEWVDGHSRTNMGLDGGSAKVVSASGNQTIRGMLGMEENIEVNKNGPGGSMMMGPPGGGGGPGGGSGGPPGGGPPGGGGGSGPGGRSGGGPPGGGGGGGGPTSMGGASAGMSQHKAEGLFPQDDKCSSNIPGLYAAGDALGSMQSGGIYTQVGSSLAGSAVQGAIAGRTAAKYVKTARPQRIPDKQVAAINTEIYAPYLRERGFSPRWITHALQGVMIPNYVLYVKSEVRMQAALTHIEYLRDHHVPLMMADNLHELRLCHEVKNMLLNAEMKLRASLMRKESRGSHYREDYPDRNDKEWLCWIKIRQGSDGGMELLKHRISV